MCKQTENCCCCGCLSFKVNQTDKGLVIRIHGGDKNQIASLRKMADCCHEPKDKDAGRAGDCCR
ncbi:hypothetical protein ACFL6M_00785 [Candidatus Eisenbacteria bacterium]|uniref:CopZ zinc binding domain-containing protein n=1 Tax=Eiseniibacteriota bacterium TaxID=2212470 RepID=A0ABV6YIE1_UNCEI